MKGLYYLREKRSWSHLSDTQAGKSAVRSLSTQAHCTWSLGYASSSVKPATIARALMKGTSTLSSRLDGRGLESRAVCRPGEEAPTEAALRVVLRIRERAAHLARWTHGWSHVFDMTLFVYSLWCLHWPTLVLTVSQCILSRKFDFRAVPAEIRVGAYFPVPP